LPLGFLAFSLDSSRYSLFFFLPSPFLSFHFFLHQVRWSISAAAPFCVYLCLVTFVFSFEIPLLFLGFFHFSYRTEAQVSSFNALVCFGKFARFSALAGIYAPCFLPFLFATFLLCHVHIPWLVLFVTFELLIFFP